MIHKIDYQTDHEYACLTPCPHLKGPGKFNFRVGSMACTELCPWYKDSNSTTVICDYPTDEKQAGQ